MPGQRTTVHYLLSESNLQQSMSENEDEFLDDDKFSFSDSNEDADDVLSLFCKTE